MARVLIVDDDAQVRVLAEGIIQELGHETLTAGDVVEANALLDTDQQIDLLFADLKLFGEQHGGIVIARRAREKRADIAVLYTTGEGVNDGTRALFVEPHVFVGKPYTVHHLTVAVQNALTTSGALRLVV